MRESEIEQYLVSKVAELGGETRKVKWIGRRGAPDRFVLLNGKAAWVELKAPNKRLGAHQMREANTMVAYGQDYHVISSKDGVEYLCHSMC